jgi:hypothetical protein
VAETLISDPKVVAKAVKDLEAAAPVVEITTEAPSDSEVSLPGGFINREGALIKYAEVRELNGADEEAIARAGSTGKALNVMIQRGLVSLGMDNASREDLEKLLSGDRDAILIGIRKATFGNTIDFEGACPNCSAEQTITLDLTKDIPVKTLEDPIEDRMWTYESKQGKVVIGLPTGLTQRRLLENNDKNSAELNTILLAGCIASVNGSPSIGASTVLQLGWKDRELIVQEILDRNPGPRLGEVSKACQACGEQIPMPLTLAALFRV